MYMRNRWTDGHQSDSSRRSFLSHYQGLNSYDRHSTLKGPQVLKEGRDECENVKGSEVDEWSWVGKNQRICDDALEYRWGSRSYES
jgi:hypothetical protein